MEAGVVVKRNIAAAVLACALLAVPQLAAAGPIGTTDESAKPQPGGIAPQTRKEFLGCMWAWTVVGNLIEGKPQFWGAEHADFTPDTASQMIQHWGKKAKSAYGAERLDAYNRDLDALMNRSSTTTEDMLRDLGMAGACHVAPGGRSIVNSGWSLNQSIIYAIKTGPSS